MLQLQVAIACCPYYHLRTQQIFMLQKVDAVSTFVSARITWALVLIVPPATSQLDRNLQSGEERHKQKGKKRDV